MPRYDFRCDSCGVFEQVVSIAERDNKVMCICGQPAKRMIGVPWQRIDINSDRWSNRHKKRG